MILFRAMINLSTVPDFGFRYDPALAGIILGFMVAVVVLLMDAKTLSRFRFAKGEGSVFRSFLLH